MMQMPDTQGQVHVETALICLFMLPELALFLRPDLLHWLMVKIGMTQALPQQQTTSFASKRFLLTVRFAAALLLLIMAGGIYLVHLGLPSYPRYAHH